MFLSSNKIPDFTWFTQTIYQEIILNQNFEMILLIVNIYLKVYFGWLDL